MALRQVPFVLDEWYHVYNRGVDKRVIFTQPDDYERFLMLLYACNSKDPIHVSNLYQGKTLIDVIRLMRRTETLVHIGSYSLMQNHFHFLIRERLEGGITSFMRRLGTGYTMYFNIRYKRTGALFEGAFKAKHVNTDQYLSRVINYIHANPAELFEPQWKRGIIHNEQRLRNMLGAYRYSSLPDYLHGEREERVLIDPSAIGEAVDALADALSIDTLISEAMLYAKDADHFLPR